MPNSIVKTLTVNGTTYDLKDVDSELYAPKASPALTGTPTAPTATSGTNSTQIATTAFVQGAVSSAIGNVNSFEVSVVQSLPTTNIDPHTIYFISNSGSTGNIYDEYMYINSNWEKIGTTDVDLSGYLAKNNTTAFTPTGDYNPATKKYVDDAMDDTYIVNFSFSEPSDVIVSDKYRDEVVLAKINGKKIIGYLDHIPYNHCDNYFYATALIDNTYPTISFLVWDDGIPETVNTLTIHDYNVDVQAYITNVLTKTNTTSYTPTGDYNPATKKYVDDKTLMVVEISQTYENGNAVYSSNKTFTEIMAHINNGGDIICVPLFHSEREFYTIANVTQTTIEFNNTTLRYNDNTNETLYSCESIIISNDNTVSTNGGIGGSLVEKSTTTPLAPGTASIGTEYAYASGDHVHPSELFVVTITSTTTEGVTTYTADKTFAQITAAVEAGKQVTAINNNYVYYYTWKNNSDIIFHSKTLTLFGSTPQINNRTFRIHNDEVVSLYTNTFQNKLTFDSTPTENSTNPVTSGGVYTALANADSTPDWSENDSTDSSYILNRPIYYEDNGDSDNDLTCIVYERPFTMPVGTNLLDIGEIDGGNLNMYYSILVGGKTKIVYANGGDPEYSTVTSNGGSYLYSLFTDVYLTPDNHIILNRFERPGEWSDTISIYVQTKAYTVDENYVEVLQSDWSEEDFTSPKYIDNRPAIRAGDGENSVIINYADDTMSDSFIVYLTGEANATSFSYTTNDTDLADMISSSILAGIFVTYSIIQYPSGSSNKYESITAINSNTITLHKSISTSALSNFEVAILYRYRMAKGINSTAEGILTKSMGAYSHAEGNNTVAYGGSSHAEGRNSIASGIASHAEGNLTIADGQYQHVEGKCNIPDTNNTYAHIVGNGSGVANRSNAYTLDWNGNGVYAGKVTVGTGPTNNMDVATKQYVDSAVSSGGGSSTLVDLTDTTITSPTNGQVLMYNSTTSKWENTSLPIYNGGVSS